MNYATMDSKMSKKAESIWMRTRQLMNASKTFILFFFDFTYDKWNWTVKMCALWMYFEKADFMCELIRCKVIHYPTCHFRCYYLNIYFLSLLLFTIFFTRFGVYTNSEHWMDSQCFISSLALVPVPSSFYLILFLRFELFEWILFYSCHAHWSSCL